MKRTFWLAGFIITVSACSAAFGIVQTTITVSGDPCVPADYNTVQAAVNAVPDNSLDAYIIEIAPGDYHELVNISSSKQFITLKGMGTDPCQTRIFYTTYDNPMGVLQVEGYNIRCENLTVENTRGSGEQANAARTLGDKMTFENCRFLGYQDTFYIRGSGAKRNYFHNCFIAGRTDFIYGDGIGLLDDCNILSTYSSTGGYITAASTPWVQKWGLIITNCRLYNDSGGSNVALGRPWKDGSMTSYLNCWMNSHIKPAGWTDWDGRGLYGLTRYSEYNSSGPGGDMNNRIFWAPILTDEQAAEYTRENILAGWDPNITDMPTMWNSTTGFWDETDKWEDGLPSSSMNAYIPTGGNVTVRQAGAEASTLTLGGSAKLYIDGSTGGSLALDELACRSTSAEVHIINYGTLNASGWTGGFGSPAGVLYIEKGSLPIPNTWGPRIILAPASGDVANLIITGESDWDAEQIQTGSGTTIIDMNGSEFYTKWGLKFGQVGADGNVTLNMSGGKLRGIDMQLSNSAGTYTINHTGGTLLCDNNSTDGYVRLGADSVYNLSQDVGPATLETKGLWVGDWGNAMLIQKAGAVIVQSTATGANYNDGVAVRIGRQTGSVGYYEIQGGSLSVRKNKNKDGVLASSGFINGDAGTGTFKVTGGGVSISIAGFYQQGELGTLAAENKGGAISTINVSGNVTFASGAKLLLTTAWGVPAGQYVLMKWTGTRTGTLTLDPSVNPLEWGFAFDNTNKQLYVVYTPQNYVNFIDLAMITDKWMTQDCGTINDYCEGADVDESGKVDFGDIRMLSEKWLLGR